MATLTTPADSARSRNGTADPGPLRAAPTPNFPALRRRLGVSLLATTHQTGRLHHLFEQSAERTPNQTALVCGSDRLSYAELDQRANRLAHHLAARGVGPGSRVGLLVERSVEAYAALLAVLKCGAAFVPLDSSFPADRIAFIAGDAGF